MKAAKQRANRKYIPANARQLRAIVRERFGLRTRPGIPCNMTPRPYVRNPLWNGGVK